MIIGIRSYFLFQKVDSSGNKVRLILGKIRGIKRKPPAVSKRRQSPTNKQMRATARPGAVCLPFAIARFVLISDWRYKYRTNSKDYDHIRNTFFQPRVAAPVVQHRDSPGRLPLCRSIRGLYWYETFRRENNLYRGGSGGAVRYLRTQGV